MEKQVLKSGWVEKRSKYLKKWRKRFLVLTTSSLCTFKSDEDLSSPTMEIPLTLILDGFPRPSEHNNSYVFCILLHNRKYLLRTQLDSEMLAWLNLINHIRQGSSLSSLASPTCTHESKVLSDESLITSFTRIKEIMQQREKDLIQQLDEYYKTYMERATNENAMITEAYQQEVNNYVCVSKVLDSSMGIVEKVKEVQNISKTHLAFKDIENFSVSMLKVSMQSEGIDKIIRPCIRVSLGNPEEVMVRRTPITRALKWRYSGERIDSISFSVSCDIKLTAIGVCTPYKIDRITSIKEFQILKGGSSNSNTIYRHSQKVSIKNNPEESVFKLAIESPVSVKKDTKYTASFLIEGAHTYKCVDCLTTVEGPKRCTWTFFNTIFAQSHQSNRCDTVCGPIADFYFTIA